MAVPRNARGKDLTFLYLRILVVLIAPIAGYLTGSISPVSALYISAGSSNLYEDSGGEKVSSLSVTAGADNWYNCNADNCDTTVNYFTVGWSINDGSSTFDGVVAYYYGVEWYCEDWNNYILVYASPSYPVGSQYISGPGVRCKVGIGTQWNPSAGMCDTASYCYWFSSEGPRVSWIWSPPSTSASSFQYWW